MAVTSLVLVWSYACFVHHGYISNEIEMGMFQTLAPKQIQIGSTLKWIFNEPKVLFKNVHALWIMLGTTTRGDAHFCYTFWIFESMHKYLIWSCLNYINILMAPKMLGIGEGLWNIISRCHKYF